MSRWLPCRSISPAHARLSAASKAPSCSRPFRGLPPADTAALADLMVRLSQFTADHADDIDAIDLNPVIVHAQGDGFRWSTR